MINLPMSFALGKLVHKITQGSIYWADITSVFDGKALQGSVPWSHSSLKMSLCQISQLLFTDFKSASCHIHLLRLRTTSSVPQCYLVFLYRYHIRGTSWKGTS